MSPGVCSFSKTESRKLTNQTFMQNGATGLPRKMRFLMRAHFEILRLPLDSWRQNKLVGGLSFQFRPLVSPACKSRQTLI